MGNTHGQGTSQISVEMMGRLPLLLRTGSMRRAPVESVGQRGSGGCGGDGGTSGGSGGGDSQRQQEHGLVAVATGISEPKSPSPLPPSSTRRRRAATTPVVLSLIVFGAAAAAVWSSSSSSARLADRGSGTNRSNGSLSELPFLGGEDGGGQARMDASRWVRVRSASAMHPAMYVPGDGMVYCPIAKVRRERMREVGVLF